MQHEKLIGILDSDTLIGDGLSILLDNYDVGVESFASVASLIQACARNEQHYDCILVSSILPEGRGISLLRQISTNAASIPLILLVDTYDPAFHQQALQLGVTEIVEKSLVASYLSARLDKAGGVMSSQENSLDTKQVGRNNEPPKIRFRMMEPDDVGIEQEFIRNLSPTAKQFRFFSSVGEIPDSLLYQFTHTVFPGSLALIATIVRDGRERQVGVARYAPTGEDGIAEFAVVVDEQWQRQGIASKLLRGLIAAACIGGINRLQGMVLRENNRMLGLAHNLGFVVSPFAGDRSLVCVTKQLRESTIDKNRINDKSGLA